jgi:magnesium-transporting ATPase (P-type)
MAQAGDRAPADIHLLDSNVAEVLGVDVSAVVSPVRSALLPKSHRRGGSGGGSGGGSAAAAADAGDMLIPCGAMVTSGSALGVVVAIGAHTVLAHAIKLGEWPPR